MIEREVAGAPPLRSRSHLSLPLALATHVDAASRYEIAKPQIYHTKNSTRSHASLSSDDRHLPRSTHRILLLVVVPNTVDSLASVGRCERSEEGD
jgi:hypothetical protein